jgi:uncharacterized protein with GYD domain
VATYILLLTLTPEGREKMQGSPDSMLQAIETIAINDVDTLGLYGVLGVYDFVSILNAPDNESAARFSIELGVRAGVHVTTLPAIPVSRLRSPQDRDPLARDETTANPPAADAPVTDA